MNNCYIGWKKLATIGTQKTVTARSWTLACTILSALGPLTPLDHEGLTNEGRALRTRLSGHSNDEHFYAVRDLIELIYAGFGVKLSNGQLDHKRDVAIASIGSPGIVEGRLAGRGRPRKYIREEYLALLFFLLSGEASLPFKIRAARFLLGLYHNVPNAVADFMADAQGNRQAGMLAPNIVFISEWALIGMQTPV